MLECAVEQLQADRAFIIAGVAWQTDVMHTERSLTCSHGVHALLAACLYSDLEGYMQFSWNVGSKHNAC